MPTRHRQARSTAEKSGKNRPPSRHLVKSSQDARTAKEGHPHRTLDADPASHQNKRLRFTIPR